MTNLLEKSLLTGFGIFTLIIFFSIVIPFFGEISEFKENKDEWKEDLEEESEKKEKEEEEIDKSLNFLNKFNKINPYVLECPKDNCIKDFKFPRNFNFASKKDYIKFNCIIKDKIPKEILENNRKSFQKICHIAPLQTYLLSFPYYLSFRRLF